MNRYTPITDVYIHESLGLNELIGQVGAHFGGILILIQIFTLKKIHLKMSVKCSPFHVGFNMLRFSSLHSLRLYYYCLNCNYRFIAWQMTHKWQKSKVRATNGLTKVPPCLTLLGKLSVLLSVFWCLVQTSSNGIQLSTIFIVMLSWHHMIGYIIHYFSFKPCISSITKIGWVFIVPCFLMPGFDFRTKNISAPACFPKGLTQWVYFSKVTDL